MSTVNILETHTSQSMTSASSSMQLRHGAAMVRASNTATVTYPEITERIQERREASWKHLNGRPGSSRENLKSNKAEEHLSAEDFRKRVDEISKALDALNLQNSVS